MALLPAGTASFTEWPESQAWHGMAWHGDSTVGCDIGARNAGGGGRLEEARLGPLQRQRFCACLLGRVLGPAGQHVVDLAAASGLGLGGRCAALIILSSEFELCTALL